MTDALVPCQLEFLVYYHGSSISSQAGISEVEAGIRSVQASQRSANVAIAMDRPYSMSRACL